MGTMGGDEGMRSTQSLCREGYVGQLTYEGTKVLLAGVMHLVYVTEWISRLEESRKAKERQGGEVSHGDDARLDGGNSSPDRSPA